MRNLRWKNILYSLGLLSAMYLVWHYREGSKIPMVYFSGETMGTTYHIKYFDNENRNFQTQIDSLLDVFNQSLSTYIPGSEISQFNRDSLFQFKLPYFKAVVKNSRDIVSLTSGAFDPTVMPLVNAWGFGPEQDVQPDSVYIDSLKQYVGFNKVIRFDEQAIWKTNVHSTLDFSAIAKGYGVDVVAEFITSQQIDNLFVEIGGEVVCKGKNQQSGNNWKLAIIDPDSELINPEFIAQLEVVNRAVATSANNFNYRIVDGVKYSHIISPYSGFPIKQPILSATVIAKDCMTADALATSFMVMGHEKAIGLLKDNPDIDAFLIFSDSMGRVRTYISHGIENQIKLTE